MKTISGTLIFVVAAVIAVVAVLSFHAFAAGSKPTAVGAKKFKLKIGKTQTDYVDVDIDAFKKALEKFSEGDIDIYYLEKDGAPVKHWPPVSIKTDKVTTSEVAKNTSAGSVANDPNVTRNLSTDSAADLKAVLDTFK
jgi:hypothetical protein